MATSKPLVEEEIHRFEESHKDIAGKRWYNGVGNPDADILFVDSWPGDEIKRTNRPLSDRVGKCLQWLLRLADIDAKRCYYTYVVKYPIPTGKKPSSTDKKRCATMLTEEIAAVKPKVVVAFGTDAWAAVANARLTPFACCRGEPIPTDQGYTLFPTLNLPQVMMHGGEGYKDRLRLEDIPQHVLVHTAVRELSLVKRLADGEDLKATYAAARPRYDVLTTPEEIDFVHAHIKNLPGADGLLCLDCEWDGDNWLDPHRYIRTIQIGYRKGDVAIVKLHEVGGVPSSANPHAVMQAVKRLLEDPAFGIVGHNVISDGEWLLQAGIDIRHRVVYDTMLGEYLLCEDGPFGLEEAAMKYAPYGRYCAELECWVKQNGKLCKKGFGNVPDAILLPYGAADVDCLRYIMEKQLPMLASLGYLEPRGTEKEYPTMLQETLNTQRVLYEIEGTGMLVDRKQLDMLIDKFQSKKADLLAQLVVGAAQVGMPDFNPGSPAQVKELLFQKLGLAPVKTTGGKDWAEAVGNWGLDEDIDEQPGTDKQTLEILGDAHPLVKTLLQYRRVEQPAKTWLRHKTEDNPDRGLEAQMWADGRLHSHMSQLSTTGRFKSSAPNCFPKEVEVLTDRGWMSWDKAYARQNTGLKLAQWDMETPDREISFDTPLQWHTAESELIRFFTDVQLEIVCTPNHRFEVFHRKTGMRKCITALELDKHCDFKIPQAGTLKVSPGTRHLTDSEVTLLCATQADGTIVKTKLKGITCEYGIEYAFTKQRKIDRLRTALKEAGIPFSESESKTSYGASRTRFYVGKKYRDNVFFGFKYFSVAFMQFDADTLNRISNELFLWDGTVLRDGTWFGYASSIEENTDWAQILQVFSGKRARKRKSELASEKWAPLHHIDTTPRQTSSLARGKLERLDGIHTVYCATMPKDTLIVRYNGKVLFTRNSQNFPKRAEGFMTEIFGEGNEPPVVRTIVVPPPGMYMMESDFCQAELFTAASLSGDQHMLDVLTTPGRDMHTSIAARSFGWVMHDDAGREITEDDVVEIVRKQYGGDAENKEFKAWQKHTYFVNAHGEKLTFSQFKAGPRISGKNCNFGVFYGRGGRDMAIQVKAESGAPESIDVLAAQFDQIIRTWKEVEYPVAWAFIEKCMAKVYEPGFIRNPWGRIRRAPFLLRGQKDAAAERNFANMPIQSTVADTVQLASEQMVRWREEHNMHFEIQNQIHDAIMLHVPKDEVEETKDMFRKTMGSIRIPLLGTDYEHPGGPDYFTLGVDIDVYERWGQKVKD